MALVSTLPFFALLLLTTARPLQYTLVNSVLVPNLKSDFSKNNVNATWAPSYPKEWGSELYSYQFNEPAPEDYFGGTVTPDEKYLAMQNGTHVTFIDLDSNSTVATLSFGLPQGARTADLTVRAASQGGYDVLAGGVTYKYDIPLTTTRIRLSSDLKLIGSPIQYQGAIGSISKQGTLATLDGYIYDLNSDSSTSTAQLSGLPDVTDLSFGPDGVHLSSVSWHAETADLWNATSGEKLFTFPATNTQNWATAFSNDGKYVGITLGNSVNIIRVYALENLTAAPIELKPFNDWPRSLAWSPDSKYLATGDRGRLRVWKMPEAEVVQTWEVDGNGDGVYEINGLKWLDDGKKITFMFRSGTYMYDFDQNTKWWWTVRVSDHTWNGGDISLLSSKGLVATEDGDSKVRIWKI